jgi:hypothetical protein
MRGRCLELGRAINSERDRIKAASSIESESTEGQAAVAQEVITISPGARLRAAIILAVVADALQVVVFPLFVPGAVSPVDDVVDVVVGGTLTYLLGWHWEFLPSFCAKLLPGIDLVPFWTLAVGNVYRKSRRVAVNAQESLEKQTVHHGTPIL